MTKHTCTCTACNGLSFMAPEGYISGTPKQQRDMIHNYAQYAHGTSPVARTLTARAGIQAA